MTKAMRKGVSLGRGARRMRSPWQLAQRHEAARASRLELVAELGEIPVAEDAAAVAVAPREAERVVADAFDSEKLKGARLSARAVVRCSDSTDYSCMV